MKLVLQIRLLPTPAQATALEATLRACNEAAAWVAEVAFETRTFRNFTLRKHTYAEVKERWELGAQAAQHGPVNGPCHPGPRGGWTRTQHHRQ
ncbi:hypothetical protein [Streptomyces lunaelactis]|uniref:hypothetical protein n=1 Tax=Streptomyces lunaelactis TaxID=1535768 RepID=UPI001C2F760E|nr:hypothetical protein [Streptomyces lunaelactis]